MTFNNPFNTDNTEAFDPIKGFTGTVPKPKISAGLANMGVQLGAMAGNMAQIGAKQVGNANRPAFQFNNTASLAGMGTMIGGPIGTAIGGAVGLGLDALQYKKGKSEFNGQMYADGFNAWRMKRKSDVSKQDYTGMYRSGGKVETMKTIVFSKVKRNQFALKKTMFKARNGGLMVNDPTKPSIQKIGNLFFDSNQSVQLKYKIGNIEMDMKDKFGNPILSAKANDGKEYKIIRNKDGSYRFFNDSDIDTKEVSAMEFMADKYEQYPNSAFKSVMGSISGISGYRNYVQANKVGDKTDIVKTAALAAPILPIMRFNSFKGISGLKVSFDNATKVNLGVDAGQFGADLIESVKENKMGSGGVKNTDKSIPIEVESKEIGILKQVDGSYKEVFRTGKNTKQHEEGGKEVKVPEGTEVFNSKLFDAVSDAIKKGDWETIESKLIPQRDKILKTAKEKGDPYSTGLTTEEAEQTAMEEAFARSGGHMKRPMAFGGSKFKKPSKHASGGVVVPSGIIEAVTEYKKGVPDGMGQRLFGGQSFGIENAMSANPSKPILRPLGLKSPGSVETSFDNRPAITGLPKQSYGDALKTVARSVSIPSIKESSLYDKASIYSLGAAAVNAAQPEPNYQRARRVALSRVKYDGTAIDEAKSENMAASNQILKGFGNSVRGVGSMMGVAASVAKSAMDNNSKLSVQKAAAVNQVQMQNAQIQNQEDSANTQIANQESAMNEQLRFQHAQAKAQGIKANTDAAFQSQFQEEQLRMQQEAIGKQQDVQKKALGYMVSADKWYQSISSPEATSHALSLIEQDDAKAKELLGDSVDKFMMLRSDSPELKPLLDQREKALKEFEEKGFDAQKSFIETNYGKYKSEYEKIAKFERGELEEYNGLKFATADAESKKQHIANARAEYDMAFRNKLKEAGLGDSEIDQLKGTDSNGISSYHQDDRILEALKSRAKTEYVRANVYDKELERRMKESRLRMNDYKKDFAKGLGLAEPNPDVLLN